MAYTFRSSSSQGNASGGALTVNKPAGVANGDLLIAVAYLETGTNTWTSVGAGWNSVGNVAEGTEFTVQVWWKWASSEPASWTWTPNVSGWRVVVVAAYSGGGGSGIAKDVAGSNSGAAQFVVNQTAPSVTTTAANDLLTFDYGNFSGTDATSLIGAATNLRVTLGGCCIGDANIASASSTGTTHPGDGPGTDDFAAFHAAFFLNPAGAPAYAPKLPLINQAVNRASRY